MNHPKIGSTARPRFVVFDLDGTLIDSQTDLCKAVNATLAHLGAAPIPDTVVASFIGSGVAALLSRSIDYHNAGRSNESLPDQATKFFLSYYREHMLDSTYVYPGALESLQIIRQHLPELPMAVLTNKPVRPAREICAKLGLNEFFFRIYGGDSFATKKPDPLGLATLIREASEQVGQMTEGLPEISNLNTVLIGDSDIDILTARNCACRSIGCTFGLAPERLMSVEPEALAHSPSEWPDLLGL